MASTSLALLLLSSLIAASTASKVPTMVAKVSESGFKFFGEDLANKLTAKFQEQALPSIVTSVGEDWLNLYYLKVNEFVSPTVIIRPVAGAKIRAETSGGVVGFSGTWDANYTMHALFVHPTIRPGGKLTVKAQNFNSWVELEVFADDVYTPQVRVTGCELSLPGEDDVDVQLHGSLMANVVNLFNGAIKGKFRKMLPSEYCKALPNALTELNDYLKQYMTGYSLAEKVTAQYGFISSADKDGKEYTVSTFVDLLYDKRECSVVEHHPVDVNVGPISNDESMMTIWLSSSIFNCFLEGFHQAHLTDWTSFLTQSTPKWGEYLATSCTDDRCVGSFVPQLVEKFPQQFVRLNFLSVQPPYVNFTDATSALVTANINLQLLLDNASVEELALFHVITSFRVEPYVQDNRLFIKIIDAPSLNVSVLSSMLDGKANSSNVWKEFIYHIQPIFMEDIKTQLANGFVLPTPPLLSISNDHASITFGPDQVRIGFDFINADFLVQNDAFLDYEMQFDAPSDYQKPKFSEPMLISQPYPEEKEFDYYNTWDYTNSLPYGDVQNDSPHTSDHPNDSSDYAKVKPSAKKPFEPMLISQPYPEEREFDYYNTWDYTNSPSFDNIQNDYAPHHMNRFL